MRPASNCRQGVARLMEYVEGTLPLAERRALDHHVSRCRRCRGFVASYLATPRIVLRATAEPLPRRVARGLRRRLAGMRRSSSQK